MVRRSAIAVTFQTEGAACPQVGAHKLKERLTTRIKMADRQYLRKQKTEATCS